MAATKHLYYPADFSAPDAIRGLPKQYQVAIIPRTEARGASRRPPETKWTFPAVILLDAVPSHLALLHRLIPKNDSWGAVCFIPDRPPQNEPAVPSGSAELDRLLRNRHILAWLPRQAPRIILEATLARAFEDLRTQEKGRRTQLDLKRAARDLETLNRIGIALSTERSLDALLELILTKSREITGADAGSIYLVEEGPAKENGGGSRHLAFRLAENDSREVSFEQYSLPIDEKSLAGYAALTGAILNLPDAYRLPAGPQLNRGFDQRLNYRTRSVLVVPIKNQRGEVSSVLQLINAKRRPEAVLDSPEAVRREVTPFSARSRDLAASLASQAGVAVENSKLYRDIQRLFEGFVKAAITAIESRDPTTFGHSERVARLTVGLAECVDRSRSGPYAGVRFSGQDLEELRYASLLHDFGKVGVREHVLVKAKKLYAAQLEAIRQRFCYACQTAELVNNRRKVEYLLRHGNRNFIPAFSQFDADCQREADRLAEFLDFVIRANEPSASPPDAARKLSRIASVSISDGGGEPVPLLTAEEAHLLSIPRGSLDPEERAEIESHVLHSFRFLSQIPWTRELEHIPEIVKAHHERLDGSGYPFHATAEQIPVQARMIAISDIYDALTARDRPYKQAVPAERALDIMNGEVKSNLLDPALFQIFVEGEVYRRTAGQ